MSHNSIPLAGCSAIPGRNEDLNVRGQALIHQVDLMSRHAKAERACADLIWAVGLWTSSDRSGRKSQAVQEAFSRWRELLSPLHADTVQAFGRWITEYIGEPVS